MRKYKYAYIFMDVPSALTLLPPFIIPSETVRSLPFSLSLSDPSCTLLSVGWLDLEITMDSIDIRIEYIGLDDTLTRAYQGPLPLPVF